LVGKGGGDTERDFWKLQRGERDRRRGGGTSNLGGGKWIYLHLKTGRTGSKKTGEKKKGKGNKRGLPCNWWKKTSNKIATGKAQGKPQPSGTGLSRQQRKKRGEKKNGRVTKKC